MEKNIENREQAKSGSDSASANVEAKGLSIVDVIKSHDEFSQDLKAIYAHRAEVGTEIWKGMKDEVREHPVALAGSALFGAALNYSLRGLPDFGTYGKAVYLGLGAIGALSAANYTATGVIDIGRNLRTQENIDNFSDNAGSMHGQIRKNIQQYGHGLAETGASLLGAGAFEGNLARLDQRSWTQIMKSDLPAVVAATNTAPFATKSLTDR